MNDSESLNELAKLLRELADRDHGDDSCRIKVMERDVADIRKDLSKLIHTQKNLSVKIADYDSTITFIRWLKRTVIAAVVAGIVNMLWASGGTSETAHSLKLVTHREDENARFNN